MQGEFEKALRRLGWQADCLKGAGRTDAGVHALGQVVAFDLEWKHSEAKLLAAINANLPADMAARSVRPVPTTFDPRRSARSRTYHYHLFFEPVREPVRERYAWRVWPPPQPQLMQQAARLLLGRHDFAAFGAPPRPESSTIRNLLQADWLEQPQGWLFVVSADAFLYHMVRKLVALQVQVGQGKLDLQSVSAGLDGGASQRLIQALVLAPPNGLFLTEVHYPPAALALE